MPVEYYNKTMAHLFKKPYYLKVIDVLKKKFIFLLIMNEEYPYNFLFQKGITT